MATTPTQTHALLTTPFSHTTDFTELADNCEHYAYSLVECDDIAEKLALCGRLSTCLALLQPTLHEPVPAHLIPHFTVNDLPARQPAFEPESDQLGQYCQVLTQLLIGRALPLESTRVIEDLLCELVGYYADTLKAPRWINTPEGNVAIN